MKKALNLTINQVALAALIVAVVSIAAVSIVSVVALHNLIDTNARVLRVQRIISSLEAIRFQALAIDNSEQAYVITGNRADLSTFLTAGVEMRAEAELLADKRGELPKLNELAADLKDAVEALIAIEKKIVETRRHDGFVAAQSMVRDEKYDTAQQQVISITHRILVDARRLMADLEVAQVLFADRVQRWIVALISSSALVLVFFHGVVRKLSNAQIAARGQNNIPSYA